MFASNYESRGSDPNSPYLVEWPFLHQFFGYLGGIFFYLWLPQLH